MGNRDYSRELQVITDAGEARYEASLAARALKEKRRDEYGPHLEAARAKLKEAHGEASRLIRAAMEEQKEAAALIQVHALTHLAMAQEALEHAEETAWLYERIGGLEDRVKKLEERDRAAEPVRVMLVCANGISTSMLIRKMQEHMGRADLVEAVSVFHVGNRLDQFDVVLLAPHMKPQAELVKSLCRMKKKPFGVIDAGDYGRLDGRAVLKQARSLI